MVVIWFSLSGEKATKFVICAAAVKPAYFGFTFFGFVEPADETIWKTNAEKNPKIQWTSMQQKGRNGWPRDVIVQIISQCLSLFVQCKDLISTAMSSWWADQSKKPQKQNKPHPTQKYSDHELYSSTRVHRKNFDNPTFVCHKHVHCYART